MDRWLVIGILFVTAVVPPSDWLAHHPFWVLLWAAALITEMVALTIVSGQLTFNYRRRK